MSGSFVKLKQPNSTELKLLVVIREYMFGVQNKCCESLILDSV